MVAAASLLAVGCSSKAPGGQVVAVVNGQDITSQDLAAEARASGGGGGASGPAMLQRVIARVLLAQSAHRRKLDQYAGYPSDKQRLEQTFLAQRLVQTVVPPAGRPSSGDIAKFVAQHPFAFDRREKLKLDQIRYSSPVNVAAADLHSMFAITTRLTNMGIAFERSQQTIDTATLPAPYVEKMLSLPAGEPFILRQGDATIVNVITGSEKVQVPQAERDASASRAMEQLRVSQLIDGQVKQLKDDAKITYQPGYAPKPPAAKPAEK